VTLSLTQGCIVKLLCCLNRLANTDQHLFVLETQMNIAYVQSGWNVNIVFCVLGLTLTLVNSENDFLKTNLSLYDRGIEHDGAA
jgi:hypothetical protein